MNGILMPGMRMLLASMALCALGSLSACGSVVDAVHPEARCHIYGGVRSDWEMVAGGTGPWEEERRAMTGDPVKGSGRECVALCSFLDFPLSLVLDTAFLPWTTLLFLFSDSSPKSCEVRDTEQRRQGHR